MARMCHGYDAGDTTQRIASAVAVRCGASSAGRSVRFGLRQRCDARFGASSNGLLC
jgi:hypothetical protein